MLTVVAASGEQRLDVYFESERGTFFLTFFEDFAVAGFPILVRRVIVAEIIDADEQEGVGGRNVEKGFIEPF